MSSLMDTKRESYRAQRQASQGTAITLVAGCGFYAASFGCALSIAEVLGSRELKDAGDGIYEVIPTYRIPIENLYPSLLKISAKFTVALVEYSGNGQFVLLWRITRPAIDVVIPASSEKLNIYDCVETRIPTSTNLDDY